MRTIILSMLLVSFTLFAGCAPQSTPSTPIPTDTLIPPSPTVQPTATLDPTETPIPPTPTTAPQPLLLRGSCGRNYVVRSDEPLRIYYGGWAVKGKATAQEWATALAIDLTIDGAAVTGKQQPPAPDLPYNCPKDYEDSYWLYYVVDLTGLAAGDHRAEVTFRALRALPDGYGDTYGPGTIAKQRFSVAAQ